MKNLKTAVIILLICLTMPVSVTASEKEEDETGGRIHDQDRIGSLVIHYALHEDRDILSGADFSIIQTAVLSDQAAQIYTLTDPFKEMDISFDGMTAEGSAKAADTFYRFTEKRKLSPDFSACTDEQGDALFDGLSRGIYLVYQTGSREGSPASAFENALPFLVMVPDRKVEEDESEWTSDEAAWNFHVTAYPKSEPEMKLTETPTPEPYRTRTDSVKTGDETDILLFICSAIISFVLLIFGCISARSKNHGRCKSYDHRRDNDSRKGDSR